MKKKKLPPSTRAHESPNLNNQEKHEYLQSEGRYRLKYNSNLEKYLDTNVINEDQFRAGMRLYQDAVKGGVLSGIKGQDYTSFMQPRGSGGKRADHISDYVAIKQQEFGNAMYSQELGRKDRQILWHICIEDGDLSSFDPAERSTLYARKCLKEALQSLLHHYRGGN